MRFGVSLVDKAGQSLAEIVAKIQNIDINIKAIATSVKEQSVGLQEINEAVTVIDQGTQQNAAMVEQTTASSHGLAREAEALFELLSHFQLGTAAAEVAASVDSSKVEALAPSTTRTRLPATPTGSPRHLKLRRRCHRPAGRELDRVLIAQL